MPRFLEIKNTLYFPRCVAIRPESGKKYGGWSAWKKFLKVAVFSAWRIVLQMPHFVEIKNILCFAKKSFAKIRRSNSRKKIPKYCPVSSMAQEPPLWLEHVFGARDQCIGHVTGIHSRTAASGDVILILEIPAERSTSHSSSTKRVMIEITKQRHHDAFPRFLYVRHVADVSRSVIVSREWLLLSRTCLNSRNTVERSSTLLSVV